MTWSIVARDDATGQFGIAVATCAFAVGGRVPFIATGAGAVATQAFVNPFYGSRGLELLRAGAPAADVVRVLTEADEGRGQRQVHVLDARGRVAAWSDGRSRTARAPPALRLSASRFPAAATPHASTGAERERAARGAPHGPRASARSMS